MKNLLNKQLKNEKGLTLIELLAVIVILAIVAAIAIPSIGNIISNSKSKAILSDASQIISSTKTALADGACASETECTGKELKEFVEDAKDTLTDGDSVVKTGNSYEISYEKFEDLNENDKFKTIKTAKKATDKELVAAMGKK
ncbi:MAG: prepilin-type N-terminal cleavage/methylation domain-containing protein [Kurthia sp.]|nr:prepilin-type N-terminal cleavage/methylation domain-containing protein [Candidatus Kurthia equi]